LPFWLNATGTPGEIAARAGNCAVVPVIFFAIGIQSPTCGCSYLGEMRSALAEPTL
jgi:hypothetical protein